MLQHIITFVKAKSHNKSLKQEQTQYWAINLLAHLIKVNFINRSITFTEQLNGLLAHMLVFAGHKGHQIKTLTFDFFRWVFEQKIKTVNRLAREALS
ncbi:hypothetical protein [Shewanella japonica]|uniref:hypothetical protein n=1 Tax=Shewanella japonica TaxID=93973 RepID=UPI000E77144B|nr:hypothetical protein [Shewanella japonica]